MKAKLVRYFSDKRCTLGILKFEGIYHRPLFILENPWLDNQSNISSIPKGVYKVTPYSSAKYDNVYQLHDVPGRSAILIHRGNFVVDTKGCLLPGVGVEPEKPMVTNSGIALDMIRNIVGKNEFELTIEDI